MVTARILLQQIKARCFLLFCALFPPKKKMYFAHIFTAINLPHDGKPKCRQQEKSV